MIELFLKLLFKCAVESYEYDNGTIEVFFEDGRGFRLTILGEDNEG